jgi:hypothetical protein
VSIILKIILSLFIESVKVIMNFATSNEISRVILQQIGQNKRSRCFCVENFFM